MMHKVFDRTLKVLITNNYSMENAYSLWENGKSGSHHVWGKVELERKGNIQMETLQHERFAFLNKLGNLLGITHLDQQIRILGHNNFDILYAPYAFSNTAFLVFLKWIGIFRKPIVVTIHQPFLGTRSKNKLWRKITRKALLQYDSTIFLSEPLMKDTVELLDIPSHIANEKFSTAQWGPDTEFYANNVENDPPLKDFSYAVSAGHTDRDYVTLTEAFRKINFPLKIYCTPNSAPKIKNLPENVTIHSKRIPYVELLEIYQKARLILIPMNYPKKKGRLSGHDKLAGCGRLGKAYHNDEKQAPQSRCRAGRLWVPCGNG